MAVFMVCSQPLKIPKPVDQKMSNVNNCLFDNITAILHILKPVPRSTTWRCAMPWQQTTLVACPNKTYHQTSLTFSNDTRHVYHTMYSFCMCKEKKRNPTTTKHHRSHWFLLHSTSQSPIMVHSTPQSPTMPSIASNLPWCSSPYLHSSAPCQQQTDLQQKLGRLVIWKPQALHDFCGRMTHHQAIMKLPVRLYGLT
jgi:hypothetical protein